MRKNRASRDFLLQGFCGKINPRFVDNPLIFLYK